ncbi:MAG TPA: hypothetical protein VGJ26_14740, partial [Pirellulales bacterium]
MKVADLKIVTRLVFSHARQHPARMLLTVVSTIAAACIVVWVVSGYDSLVQKFDDFAEGYLGRYELVVLPVADPSATAGPMGGGGVALSIELIEAMRKDPAVAAVEPIYQARSRVSKPGAPIEQPAPPPAANPDRIPTSAEVNASMRAGRMRMNRTPTLLG